MKKYVWGILIIILVLVSISMIRQGPQKQDKSDKITEVKEISNENLIFQSGFEQGIIGSPQDAHTKIIGIDTTYNSKNDWKSLDNNPYIGSFKIQYQGGTTEDRYARIIQDPNNPNNNVLNFYLKNPSVGAQNTKSKGRIQANIYGNTNLKSFSQEVSMYLHNDFSLLTEGEPKFDWLTTFEFWNNANWKGEDYPFRITVNIMKKEKGKVDSLYFQVHGQIYNEKEKKWQNVWKETNTNFEVKIGEWMQTRIDLVEGDKDKGKFIFSITSKNNNPVTIFEINDFTHHPDDPSPNGINDLNPMKLYTSKDLLSYIEEKNGVLQIYWDDFKFYVNQ